MNINDEYDTKSFKRNWIINTELPVSFRVQYSSNIFDPNNHDLLHCGDSERRIVLIDKTVMMLYGDRIVNYFSILKIKMEWLMIEATEENKNWDMVDEILDFFENVGLKRREAVIVIGGGVMLDLAGFACSIYRRGVPYVKVPTTLLAIVDASVGVKTGANHFDRRNRIGTYYPPITSLLDKSFIKTEKERNIVNGLGEIFKIALIKNKELFDLLEENSELLLREKFQFGAVPVKVINLAITNMIEELAPNLWEKKLDRCVDFGHTFAPLIEMRNIPNLYHGEAVALDCLLSSCIAYNRGNFGYHILERIFKVAKSLKLPTYHDDFCDYSIAEMALEDTKKHRNGNQYLPVPISIGNYKFINDLSLFELQEAIETFRIMPK